MRLVVSAILATAGLVVWGGVASAQVVRVHTCGSCTRIVQKGPGVVYGAVPVQAYGAVPVQSYGVVPVQSYGAFPVQGYGGFPVQGFGGVQGYGGFPVQGYGGFPVQGFGGVPGYGGFPVQGFGGVSGNGFGSTATGDQFGGPLGVLATQAGIDLVRQIVSQILGQGQAPAGATAAGSQFPRAPVGGAGGVTPAPAATADLTSIHLKLDAILVNQAVNTTAVLKAVSAADAKLDAALQKLDAIKPKTDKLP